MLKTIWNWFKSIFTKSDNQSTLLKIFIGCFTSVDLEAIKNQNIGLKAIQFVKELNERTDLSGTEKAALFNEKLGEYAKKIGISLAKFTLNLIREIAYASVKIAVTEAATALLLAQAEREINQLVLIENKGQDK